MERGIEDPDESYKDVNNTLAIVERLAPAIESYIAIEMPSSLSSVLLRTVA